MNISRLLLHYVKSNEIGQKDMIKFIPLFLKNINNKENPKLCHEIMSCFYKENEIFDFIDQLLKILIEHGDK